MFIDHTTSREDLQIAILSDNGLYAMVDEAKFLADGYTDAELFGFIHSWIAAGDVTA